MLRQEIENLVRNIVQQAKRLKDAHTSEQSAPVNYACIFAQSHDEYEELLKATGELGSVVKEIPSGLLFKIAPLPTVAGDLQLLKIRKPDPTRPELGDADFTVTDYAVFKAKYLGQPHFKLIERETMEMIELMDPAFTVRAYFSHPPLTEQLGIQS